MIYKFKAMGLALVAVLAMGALTASAAQAGKIMSDSNTHSTLHGEGTNTHVFKLTDQTSLTAKCKKSTFTGAVTEPSTTQRLHPEYSECEAFGFATATITTTGCDYMFHFEDTAPPGSSLYDASMSIECEAGKSITIVAGTCEVDIGSNHSGTAVNQGLKTIRAKNGVVITVNDVTLEAELRSIKYIVTKDGFLCPLDGTGTFVAGDYDGTITLKAERGGAPEGVTLED